MAVLASVIGKVNLGALGGGTGEISIVQKSVTPVAVAAATTASQNIAFDAGDAPLGSVFLFLNGPEQAGIFVESVSAIATADTLPVKFGNTTAGSLTPTSGIYVFLRIRYF